MPEVDVGSLPQQSICTAWLSRLKDIDECKVCSGRMHPGLFTAMMEWIGHFGAAAPTKMTLQMLMMACEQQGIGADDVCDIESRGLFDVLQAAAGRGSCTGSWRLCTASCWSVSLPQVLFSLPLDSKVNSLAVIIPLTFDVGIQQ